MAGGRENSFESSFQRVREAVSWKRLSCRSLDLTVIAATENRGFCLGQIKLHDSKGVLVMRRLLLYGAILLGGILVSAGSAIAQPKAHFTGAPACRITLPSGETIPDCLCLGLRRHQTPACHTQTREEAEKEMSDIEAEMNQMRQRR